MSDNDFMRLAIEQAEKCPPSQTAYSVGALIVKNGDVLSRGYSREFPDFHAEESALYKMNYRADGCTIYSTMEPCSIRKSRPKSCTQLIIESGAVRVAYGCEEPSNFVADCKGVEILQENDIEVDFIKELEDDCLKPNRHLLK